MKSKVLFVYDDIVNPSDKLKNIVGDLKFSEVLYRRKNFKDYVYSFLEGENYSKIHLRSMEDIKHLKQEIINYSDYKVIHLFSYSMIDNGRRFELLLKKLAYSASNAIVQNKNKILMASFKNIEEYGEFIDIRKSTREIQAFSSMDFLRLKNEYLYDLSDYNTFIGFISGSFDARFFNKLDGDEYTVTKISEEKTKIKKEYKFYHLLPEEMQSSFVLPYDYREDEKVASYTMERYNFTDMAIRWVNQAISLEEFERFMKRAFRFIETRNEKNLSEEEYLSLAEDLYIHKLRNRVEDLKEHKKYRILADYIETGSKYSNIDEIIDKYEELYRKMVGRAKFEYRAVIGHGDFCFSNILYDKDTANMKLIDPRGALTEDELWTDPYYDLAKLSHSICGLYDFFNNGLYDIKINDDLKLELIIDVNVDKYIDIFKEFLQDFNYDYNLVRLYEASLFLSMLPLHMDYPQKVLGFFLNGIGIMEEVEKNI